MKKFELGRLTIYAIKSLPTLKPKKHWLGYWNLFEVRFARAFSLDYSYIGSSLAIRFILIYLVFDWRTYNWRNK